jgi:patatin-like phospholipase/acyl hydrolase
MRSLEQHFDPQLKPKRILSLDGGGIRGALTLGYLKKLESILREKEKDPTLLLCDYFDLIGGTSTGAIIASALAIGKSADEIKTMYMDLGGKIFGEKRNWWNPFETHKYLKANYDVSALENSLKETFGDITLGSDKIRTGLCIVSKRADTNSVWPLINHPKGKFFDTDMGKNKNIMLWQAIRASSAAPTYFVPQNIDVGMGQVAAFVDGGVSMSNNPALTLLMVATMKGFPFHWEMGADKLSLVSVGTGYSVFKKFVSDIDDATMLTWASNVPDMLMADASWQNRVILQWLSKSHTAENLDDEMGNLDNDLLTEKPLINYLRYNFPITENSLNGLGLGHFTSADVANLVEMSHAGNREILYNIGLKASDEIKPDHFATSSTSA